MIYKDSGTGTNYIHSFAYDLLSSPGKFTLPINMNAHAIIYNTADNFFWVAASFDDSPTSKGLAMLTLTATSTTISRYDFPISEVLHSRPVIKLTTTSDG